MVRRLTSDDLRRILKGLKGRSRKHVADALRSSGYDLPDLRGGAQSFADRPVRDRMHYESGRGHADEARHWKKLVADFRQKAQTLSAGLRRQRVYDDANLNAAYWEWYDAVNAAIAGVITVYDPSLLAQLYPAPLDRATAKITVDHYEAALRGSATPFVVSRKIVRPTRYYILVPEGNPAGDPGPQSHSDDDAKDRMIQHQALAVLVAQLSEDLPDAVTEGRNVQDRRDSYAARNSLPRWSRSQTL